MMVNNLNLGWFNLATDHNGPRQRVLCNGVLQNISDSLEDTAVLGRGEYSFIHV